jgi:hypothetical protein
MISADGHGKSDSDLEDRKCDVRIRIRIRRVRARKEGPRRDGLHPRYPSPPLMFDPYEPSTEHAYSPLKGEAQRNVWILKTPPKGVDLVLPLL